MIDTPTRIITYEVTPEQAWADGYEFRSRELEQEEAGEHARVASRVVRELDAILDRIHAVEPSPHLEDQPRLEREDEALAVANGWPLRDAA